MIYELAYKLNEELLKDEVILNVKEKEEIMNNNKEFITLIMSYEALKAEVNDLERYNLDTKIKREELFHLKYKIDTLEELKDIIEQYPAGALIFQEYIKTSHGRDVRIQVVGDKVVTSMYRYSDTDFRANITNGGKMKEHKPSKEECMLALNTAKALELDFAGIDLLYGEDNKMLVCEVNSNAHLAGIIECTGVDVADEIVSWVLKQEGLES
jgi:glutathione synthase/RimK-type ligase-like ATP-grasp enzyme